MSDKAKILLVEDDPMVVKMYQRKLTLEGFDLTLAYNGEEGLEALAKGRPDIILLDVMMPKMNGFEMLKIVKADPGLKDIPVVILTNLGDRSEDVERSKEVGADDYWVKANMPLNELTSKIRVILDRKK
jgi:two-component system, OmpR family, response regulator CpxR